MRILLISFHFPPDAALAATRAPKLARYLLGAGHDLRVLCASDPQPHSVHALTIDPARVIRTPWRDLRAIPDEVLRRIGLASGKRKAPPTRGAVPAASAPPRPSLRNRAAQFYDSAICRPDRRYGWRKPAVEAARTLFETWMPDVIYATCPPHSTAPIADEIARMSGVPLVAEFRDRWAYDAYSDHPGWRRWLDKRHEVSVLSRAAAIVTVSPLWAQSYAERYGEDRVTLSMNGFDPKEYPLHAPVPPNPEHDTLHLLHAGSLYPNRRDPRVLFAGIAALGEQARNIRVTVMGKDVEPARAMAQEAGIAGQVDLIGPEAHDQVILRQYASDALLLLQWNDERDAGTIPGKLFECIGARRPVFATGYIRGATADIINRRDLGVFSNDPEVIAGGLAAMLARKRAVGMIAPLPDTVRDGMSCFDQFAALDPLLHRVAGVPVHLAAAE